ncbi:GNAT family N-acetyltransferase [Streptomyces thermolilacinus]|uniref:Streptothricin acetyltransferase n=1 Tax=Streptomyces thermolilacinus SPC6 TaxID=1306406 RepID=A0A1D3DNM6_9ACTN|nr:GNAT family N-acetyltransferase [Streptomyces thermolilacinus]OEJ93924.1 streptothricin acetyltransferase [Streptomyces thermolilacinus SPC6]
MDTTAYTFRTARPDDDAAIDAIDGSFTTRTVFEVEAREDGFALREVTVDPPLTKVFPDDDPGSDGGRDGDDEDGGDGRRVFVAVGPDREIAGYVAAAHVPWNRRLVVEDIEVAPAHRGRGVGRGLMGCAVAFARERGAGHLWLEVSNINAPAVRAYRRMGFALCGLDTTLYEGTASEGERALYMAMPCA